MQIVKLKALGATAVADQPQPPANDVGAQHIPFAPRSQPFVELDPSGKATLGRPVCFDFKATPNLLDAVNENGCDWARRDLAVQCVVALIASGKKAAGLRLDDAIRARLRDHGLPESNVAQLLEQSVTHGLLSKKDGGYRPAISAEELSFKVGDVISLEQGLKRALTAVRKHRPHAKVELETLLRRAAGASETWPRYPVESRWPFLKAVALLDRKEQNELLAAIDDVPALRAFPLIDATLLMLTGAPAESWVRSSAPKLLQSRIYTVAAEGWYVAGGLGRVQQYHSAAMQALAKKSAQVVTIEPYYATRPNGERLDYAALPTPVLGLTAEPTLRFEVQVDGRKVPAEAYRGTNRHGLEVWLIRDPHESYTKACYVYGRDGASNWEDFTEFFSRASLELMRQLEDQERNRRGDLYRPAAIIANDGQAAPIVPFLRADEAQDLRLKDASVWMVTHTYRNRGRFHGEQGDGLLARWRIPDQLRSDFWRICEADVTSSGVRHADGASGVAAVHVDEVSGIDPGQTLLAITNGDLREASSQVFREILDRLHPGADPEQPTAEQVLAVKREAKRAIGLDPDRPVIAYSGRLVDEKAGRQRAFTDENLRELLKSGAQVVLYGNVQATDSSQHLWHELQAFAAQVNGEGHPGKLVLNGAWGLPEQIRLLAATDLQVQDSDRGTGAAEYTESDVSANGGLQLGPPWIEGIIQRQGLLLDRSTPGNGNTLLPASGQPKDYLEAMRWVVDRYYAAPSDLGAYQARSVRLSRPLSALLTGAEYLRQLDRIAHVP